MDVVQGSAALSVERVAEGLQAGELWLAYQPKVNLRTGRVVGAEALLRWRHPELGEVSPGRFLPLVEQSDLIIDIGTWVLKTALRQIAEWQKSGVDLVVSVNVAPRQLQHPEFLNVLRRCLDAQADVHPGKLELEILESAALENTAQVRQIIETCRGWGVSFALDDFGTGYASLSYLRQIPAEVLKVDQSFIRDLLEDEDNRSLVSGVIGLARTFRRVVVAEGVETAAQGALLMRLGCEIVQGYGIARPMAPESMVEWVVSFRIAPQWQAMMDIPWALEDLPLMTAVADHHDWIERIVAKIEGARTDSPHGTNVPDKKCRFDHWYHHEGRQRYGDMSEFLEIEPSHRRLHQLVEEVVQRFESGEAVAADVLLLRQAEREFADRLESLKEWVGNRTERQLDIVQRIRAKSSNQLAGVQGLNPVEILVVDDSPSNIELLAGALTREYTVKFATSGVRALEMVAQPEKPDLILLDIMMPDMDGYEVCRRLKDDPQTHNIPIIFLTAKNDWEDQVRGFNVGGVDFITRPFHLPVVLARVRIHLNLKLRTDLLEAQVSLDTLTGVPNRRQLDEVLAVECRRMRRNLMPLSLLLIDVDHFRSYNDNYGHGAGDACLRQIAEALAQMRFGPGAFLARFSSKAFAVVLPVCAEEAARVAGDRILNLVEELRIPHAYSPLAHHITVSIGCASCISQSQLEPDMLTEVAGRALQAAKEAGRNRLHAFSVDSQEWQAVSPGQSLRWEGE